MLMTGENNIVVGNGDIVRVENVVPVNHDVVVVDDM